MLGVDVGDVGLPTVDGIDLSLVDVDADSVHSGARQLERERQTDVSQANDTGGRPLGLDAVDECVDDGR